MFLGPLRGIVNDRRKEKKKKKKIMIMYGSGNPLLVEKFHGKRDRARLAFERTLPPWYTDRARDPSGKR
jgi:hypothetical protein